MKLQNPQLMSSSQKFPVDCDNWIELSKEPVREIPDEPDDPEITPDLPPETRPDLAPEIPDIPSPEIFPDRNQPEISPSPEF
jgi:hypothetical protein